jgi:hypothetical protein
MMNALQNGHDVHAYWNNGNPLVVIDLLWLPTKSDYTIQLHMSHKKDDVFVKACVEYNDQRCFDCGQSERLSKILPDFFSAGFSIPMTVNGDGMLINSIYMLKFLKEAKNRAQTMCEYYATLFKYD